MNRFLLVAFCFASFASTANASESAKLLTNVDAVNYPGSTKVVRSVDARRPLTNSPTVLPVIGSADVEGQGRWLRVLLPGRPNNLTGWVPADKAQINENSYEVRVSRKQRLARIVRKGKTVRKFRVVIGAAKTPTPTGRFFVEETVRVGKSMTGPYVLALSARSNVLQEFNGGPGQIGLHGRIGLGDPLGSAASHGCVRFDNKAITWMSKTLPAGTLVHVQ